MIKKALKKIVKTKVLPIAYAVGASRLLRGIAPEKKLIILYHGVSDCDCFNINKRHLTGSEFEEHLKYYKKHFNVVPLAEIANMRNGSKAPERPTIALTFDDGFENNLNVVLPLLEKYNAPATFFVTTAPIEREEDILSCELLEIGCAYAKGDIVYLGKTSFKKQGQYEWLSSDHQNIYDFFQMQAPDQKTSMIKEWKEEHKLDELIKKVNRECYGLMNKQQLKLIASSPLVEIGSHAHSHHYLTLLNDAELKFELSNSKSVLEKIIGKKVESIAFPNGRYSKRVLEFCRNEGYKNLISVGLNEKNDKDIIDLFPRVDTGNADGMAFNMLTLNRNFGIHGF